jgi:hypothetical protein
MYNTVKKNIKHITKICTKIYVLEIIIWRRYENVKLRLKNSD